MQFSIESTITEDARVRKRKIEEEQVEEEQVNDQQPFDPKKFADFLEPKLDDAVACYPKDDKPDSKKIYIQHAGTEGQCAFDLDTLCEVSGYCKRSVQIEQTKSSSETTYYLPPLEIDKEIYDQLLYFFYSGSLKSSLDQLDEAQLLYLHDVADYFDVKRLRLLCQKEIATRLTCFTWENTDLLKPYAQQEGSLMPLINLFNFRRIPSLLT